MSNYLGLVLLGIGIIFFIFPSLFVRALEDKLYLFESFLAGKKISVEFIRKISIIFVIVGMMITIGSNTKNVIWKTGKVMGQEYSFSHCPNCDIKVSTDFLLAKDGDLLECGKCKKNFVWRDKPDDYPEVYSQMKMMYKMDKLMKKFK